MKKIIAFFLITLFYSTTNLSYAAVITALGGNWNAPGTWDLGRIPACGDTVVIPFGVNVHIAANVVLDGAGCTPVTIQASGSISFSNGKKIRLSFGGCMQISVTGTVSPSGSGGGASELIEIAGQNWWQASQGVLSGASGGAGGVDLGCGVMLPVELGDVAIEYIDGKGHITFQTFSERELDYFVIEVSRDGSFWQEVGTSKANGNTSSVSNYEIIDNDPFNGVSFYRLKDVNFSGIEAILHTFSGEFYNEKYLLYPVPVNKSLFVEGKYIDESTFKVVNSLGDIIEVSSMKFGDKVSFDFAQIKAGVYFLIIENEFVKKIERVVVVHNK